MLLRSFAALLMKKYPNLDKAFEAMDHSANGQLSMAEFSQGAVHLLRFAGDAKAIFKELDRDGNGTIGVKEFKRLRALKQGADVPEADVLETKRDKVAARMQRSPIKRPPPHARGKTFSTIEITGPRGERIATSAGFHSFARCPTGRLDSLLHPNELPGFDPESFSSNHGPGFVSKGPGHHSEVACDKHPTRGTKWNMGSTVSRSERFGPAIASTQGRQDQELSGAGYATYEGRHPADTWKIEGTGAHSMALRRSRMGPTMGNTDNFGLLGPKPIGPWQDSRVSLKLKTRSSPSLLHGSC